MSSPCVTQKDVRAGMLQLAMPPPKVITSFTTSIAQRATSALAESRGKVTLGLS